MSFVEGIDQFAGKVEQHARSEGVAFGVRHARLAIMHRSAEREGDATTPVLVTSDVWCRSVLALVGSFTRSPRFNAVRVAGLRIRDG